MGEKLTSRICKIIIIIGFFISVIYSFLIIYNYDENYQTFDKRKIEHKLIKGDAEFYFLEANNFLKRIKEGYNFYNASGEYTSSYIYPKIIALFFSAINEEIRIKSDEALIDNNEYIFKLKNKKTLFLILQSIFFYLSLFYFFSKKKYKINKDVCVFLISFLAIEPTIIQWHSSFNTESIFFSMLLIFFSLLIDKNYSVFKNLFIGFFIGLMYLQKTVAILLIAPIIIFYVISFKNKKLIIKNLSAILLAKFFVLIFLGYQNYLRSDTFYIIPWQAKFAGYYYAADNIESKSKKINSDFLRTQKEKKIEYWIKKNNINSNLEKDRRKLAEYQNQYFVNIVKKYPIETIKYSFFKSLQTMIQDPFAIYRLIFVDFTVKKYWEKKNFNSFLIINIFYSLLIYIISFIGVIYSFKNFEKSIQLLFLCSAIYFYLMLGWMGVSRYSIPTLICLSPFFANGIVYFKKLFKHEN